MTDVINDRKADAENAKYSKKAFKTPKILSQSDVESSIFATSISKCVFKKGRMTVSPERVLAASGLLSNATTDKSTIDLTGPQNSINVETKDLFQRETTTQYSNNELGEEIEEERTKGMRFAYLLSELEKLQGHLLKDKELSNGVITLGTFSELGHSVSL